MAGQPRVEPRRSGWALRLLSGIAVFTVAWASTAAAEVNLSPHPRSPKRPSVLEISPAAGPPGTVVTIHGYCGAAATSFALAFLVPPTGPATPGELQPTQEDPATVENRGPAGQALPVGGYPPGTWLATVTVPAGLQPGVYPVALDCGNGPVLTKPFTIPGPGGSGYALFSYLLTVFHYVTGTYFQKVPVYTGPGSTPASVVPSSTPGTLPVPPTEKAKTTLTEPTSTTSSSTTTTTCVRTHGHFCP